MTNRETGERVDAVPLYHRVFVALRDRILAGAFDRTGVLPSEHELDREFGVSRITVRRALAELERRGLIERGQGRQARILRGVRPLPVAANVTAELRNTRRIGRETDVTVLGADRIRAPLEVATALGLESGAEVIWINRLRSRAGQPVCHTSAHLPGSVADRIDLGALQTTPLVELLVAGGYRLTRVEQAIAAIAAEQPIAGQLDVAEGTPLLMLDRVVFDQSDRAVQLLRALFRSDAYRYHIAFGAAAPSTPAAGEALVATDRAAGLTD